MGRSTFRTRATIGSLALLLVAALAVPFALAPAAGAQEDPGGRGGTKEGRVLSLALAGLADAPAVVSKADDPAGLSEPDVREQLAAQSLPTEGDGSIMVRDDGRIVVNISVAAADDATVQAVTAAGAEVTVVSAEYRKLSAEIAVTDLAALAAVPGVLAVNEVPTPLTSSSAAATQTEGEGGVPPATTNVVCGTNPTGIRSEGDTQLSVATARANSAVDGTGVKVGVLSDTYNRVTSPSITTDTTNAELPGPTNPCGDTTAVQVLDPGPASGSDEGRAMVQIVHDLAPKSPLAFSSAFNSDLDFANEIRALQTAGSKVIVDDVSYYNEPFYQDGPIADAVNDVTDLGATYFSSAGNSTPQNGPTDGGSYESMAFRPMACPASVLAFDNYNNCHDYDGGGGADNGNQMTIPSGAIVRTTLGWSQPMFGVTTDLDYFLLDAASGTILAASADINSNSGTASAVEFMGWQNTSGAARNVVLVVARYAPTGTGTPRIKAIVHRNPATAVEWRGATVTGGDVAGPTIFGHNSALKAASIAAVPYNNANTVESFSSRGPTQFCWQPVNGSSPSPAMPCQTKNLDVAATDGTANSFFGQNVSGTWRFYGTSAAAPHAAAIAALQTQKQLCNTPAQRIAAQEASGVRFGAFRVPDYGSGRVTATTAITLLPPCTPPGAAGYHPLVPSRILDSRNSNGGWNAKLLAGDQRSLQVTGRVGSNIPATASAVVMNVTVTGSDSGSFLKVWPAYAAEPNVSNLNFSPGQAIPNLVTVKLGVGGRVEMGNAVGSVDVIADVVGYFDNGTGPGDRYNGIDPARLLDSRGLNGGWNSPLPSGTSRDLVVRGRGGVPVTATAIIANVTVAESSLESFLRVWPSGEAEPGVSNLNFGAGQIIPNLTMVKLGSNGNISFSTAQGSTHVIVDVVGYFDSTGSRFTAIDPTRVQDSRFGPGLTGKWGQGQTRDLTIAGAAGTNVPSGANGIIGNFTVAEGSAVSLITVFPSTAPSPPVVPTASNLNFGPGQIIPNAVAVRIPANKKVSIYNDQGTVHVIADVVGYFAP